MTTTNETQNPKLPTHIAYHVRDREKGQKSIWTRIGCAWTNADGSFNIQLDALPVDGRMNIRVASDKKENG